MHSKLQGINGHAVFALLGLKKKSVDTPLVWIGSAGVRFYLYRSFTFRVLCLLSKEGTKVFPLIRNHEKPPNNIELFTMWFSAWETKLIGGVHRFVNQNEAEDQSLQD